MDNKDAIIAELTKTVETLLKRIQKLEDEVARLKKDSNNSKGLEPFYEARFCKI